MRCVFLFLWLLATGLTTEAANRLSVKEIKGWTIVVAPDAIPSEQHAALFFQKTFSDIAGVVLPIASTPNEKKGGIFIGPAAGSGAKVDLSELGQEDLWIKVDQRAIVIAGGRPRGTLYGVYEFFERYLGVRFLTFDHTYLPQSASRGSLPCEEFSYHPPYSYRCSYYAENYTYREFSSRLRVNTWTDLDSLGGSTHEHLISHTFYQQVPVEKYGKTHPEYFALVNGVRLVPTGRAAGGPQLCVSNPAIMDIVTDSVLSQLDADPTLENVSVSQNDNDDYCRCDSCEAINRREGSPMGAQLRFVNAVAERVARKYPRVKVGTLAYQYTRKPPKHLTPRINVQVQLASAECCVLHPISDPDCPKNRAFYQDFVAWKRICKNLWIWNYVTDFRYYDIPFPNLKSIGPNGLLFKEGNVHGVFMQGNGNGLSGEMSDLRNYVVSHCLWNPALDSWSLVKEFCKLHYGKAAPQIMDYLAMIHDNAQAKGLHPTCIARPAEVGLDTAIAQRSMRYFERALAEAENASVRSRVEKASIPAYRAVIESGMTLKYESMKMVPDVRGGAAPLVERYIKLGKKYNMTMADEETPLTSLEKKLQTRLEGVPATQIENKTWKLTLVPGDDGKIMGLLHKPSGRAFLAGSRPDLSGGTLEEIGLQGYDHRQPAEFAVRASRARATLSKSLPDGSVLERTITLDSLSGRVLFESILTHHGDSPKTYQFAVRAELTAGTRQSDSSSVDLFVQDGKWRKYTGTWGSAREAALDGARGGVAFFNRRLKWGLGVLYKEEMLRMPVAQGKFPSVEIALRIPTRSVTLAKGESYVYSYAIEFFAVPPAR
jgi:hypothetical protein